MLGPRQQDPPPWGARFRALGVALVLLGGQAALAQPTPSPAAPAPAPAPPATKPRPDDVRLELRLGLSGSASEEGWKSLEVLVEHFSPRAQEGELVVQLLHVDRSTPYWTARRRVTLNGGLPKAPARRREWLRVPLGSPNTLIRAGILNAEGAIMGARSLDPRSAAAPRSLLFVSGKSTARADAGSLLLPLEAGYGDKARAALVSGQIVNTRRRVRGQFGPKIRVEVRAPEELPPLRLAYQGLDMVVLHETDLSRAGAAQREALLSWIDEGGSALLIPAKGRGWFTSLGIKELLGGRRVLAHKVDRLPNFERAYGALTRAPNRRPVFEVFQLEGALERPFATLTGSSLGDLQERLRFGRTYSFLQGLRRGRGRVFMLAADPTLPPLSTWGGVGGLLRDLDLRSSACGALANSQPNEPRQVYVDPGLFKLLDSNERPPSEVVIGILILYLLVVGPLNVLILRRSGRQPLALAWSVPLCALGFTIIVLLVGFLTKGLGRVVWRGTVVQTVQDSPRGQVDLALSLRTSAASSYSVQVGEGASLLRVARVPEGIKEQRVRAEAGQGHEAVRLDTWEQALFTGQGEVGLEGGVHAQKQGEVWVAHNRTPLPWKRVAVLGPDLRIYHGGPCAPGESVRLEKGALVSARHAAGAQLSQVLFDSRGGRKVAKGLLSRAQVTSALRLAGPCLVVRLESSPHPVRVGGEDEVELDVPLLVAPAAVWKGHQR
jgi:hypothetical protein